MSIDHLRYLLAVGFVCILRLPFCFCQLYRHNSHGTRNACSHTDISYSHVCRISSVSFFPSDIPSLAIRCILAELISACVHDQGTTPLLYFYAFLITQLPKYLANILFYFSVDNFSPVLRRKHYVILTPPLRMC